jgi:hypothetical protein
MKQTSFYVVLGAVALTALAGLFSVRSAGADPAADKDRCKSGGHANYVDPYTGQPFQNQGRCEAFVNRGGTLQPVVAAAPDLVVSDSYCIADTNGGKNALECHVVVRNAGSVPAVLPAGAVVASGALASTLPLNPAGNFAAPGYGLVPLPCSPPAIECWGMAASGQQTIAPGASVQLVLQYYASSGATVSLSFAADPGGAIAETNEQNNSGTLGPYQYP